MFLPMLARSAVRKVNLANKEQPVHKVLKVNKARKVKQAHKVLPVTMALPVQTDVASKASAAQRQVI